MSEPHESYRETQRRLALRQQTVEQLTHRHLLYGRARIATFAGAGVLAWFIFHNNQLSAWWLLAPLLLFLVLLVRHDRVLRLLEQARRGVGVYEQGLRRMEDRWIGTGIRGEKFVSAAHPYSGDLDIFGRGSLFELLCVARTQMGESCLAAWLSAPADPETIRARQAAIVDLKERLDFREALATSGEEVRSALKPQVLADWGAQPSKPVSQKEWLFVWGLLACNLGAAIYGLTGHGYYLLALLVGLDWILLWKQRPRIQSILLTTDRPARQLELLAMLLDQIEGETFEAPLLKEMQAGLRAGDQPASRQIRRLQTLLAWLSMRQNMFFMLVDAVLLWTVQFTFAIENWRAAHGGRLAHWTRVLGEFEALNSLATYAYEHPADPFPEITESGLFLQAEGVSHPLLPDKQAVRNDVRLDETQRLYIISGSNMSGKSTLLRTLGVNTVLALAGAPVRAHRFALAPIHLGASLRTQDSLQGGISRFYAEIQRLRQIVDISRDQPPLLFLLDEILHGTNSHDRRVGAEAVVRSLLRAGALGLLTTHDLTLTQIAADPDLHAVNAHLEDEIVEGKMHFDYHLRPGIVTRSNAIELMRAVGLEV
ncbi:MAG: mismatch repair protein MutS domain protein [Chthonomonadaceae bacterium]|nr:mismatch repair protein MutS domain protein [Chthonomonadaceae bacterium]